MVKPLVSQEENLECNVCGKKYIRKKWLEKHEIKCQILEDPSWHLYVIRCSDDTLYTGITTDVKRRIKEHNYSRKAAKYTRIRRPVQLAY